MDAGLTPREFSSVCAFNHIPVCLLPWVVNSLRTFYLPPMMLTLRPRHFCCILEVHTINRLSAINELGTWKLIKVSFSLKSFLFSPFPILQFFPLFIFPTNAVAWKVLKDYVTFPKAPEPQLGHGLHGTRNEDP